MTGIIDRLERGGWVTRDRGSPDRRAVLIRALRDRNPELLHLYSGMNTAMDEICAAYSAAELDVIADFLKRTASAGRGAAGQRAGAARIFAV